MNDPYRVDEGGDAPAVESRIKGEILTRMTHVNWPYRDGGFEVAAYVAVSLVPPLVELMRAGSAYLYRRTRRS